MTSLRPALALLLAALPTLAVAAAPKPYPVVVWSDVTFDGEGNVRDARILRRERLPAAFVTEVDKRVRAAHIAPRVVDGHAVTVRTGVSMAFLVTPGEGRGQVRVLGMQLGPIPLKRTMLAIPTDVGRVKDWDGTVEVTCTVGVEGRCTTADVEALPGVPQSVRTWATDSLKHWEFQSPQVDGVPVESTYRTRVSLTVEDDVPEDFREDKFERLMREK